jgi:signal transduction histidine kinase/ActR/RegA family two-component response regulator
MATSAPKNDAPLLEALAGLGTCADLEGMLDSACRAVVALGDFRTCVIAFYMGDDVGHGVAGRADVDVRARFRGSHGRSTPEGRRARRARLWAARRPGTNIVYLPAGEGPPLSSVFLPSPPGSGTWLPDDRLMILYAPPAAVDAARFDDDLFASLSLDEPAGGDRPDDAVFARLATVERFLAGVAVYVQNRLMRERLARSEEMHRRILDALPSAVLVLDGKGTVLLAGRGPAVLPGVEAGRSVFEAGWPPAVRDGLDRLVREGVALPATDLARGELHAERDLLVRGVPLLDVRPPSRREARVPVALLAVEDVTALRTMQARLVESDKMHAIGRLANGVAHEFNNLLTGVIGAVSLARFDLDEREDRGGVELLDGALAAAERGAVLTRRLQAFARPGGVLTSQRVSLAQVASEVVSLLGRTADRRIVFDLVEDGPPAEVDGDPELLEQLLVHVCVNSCDALQARLRRRAHDQDFTPRLALHVRGADPTSSTVRVLVEDNGSGMDAETLARAFEPFFTGDPSGRHPGIGLSIVRNVVERHGGTVTLRSEPDVGTRCEILLPAAPIGPDGDAAASGARGRLLVVDDDAFVLDVVVRGLRRAGFDVEPVAGGRAALALLESAPDTFDVVLLDHWMPDLSGAEVLERLAATGVTPPPVLVSTGDASQFDEGHLRGLGVRGFVPKPYRLERLVAAVEEAVRPGPDGARRATRARPDAPPGRPAPTDAPAH